MKSFYRHFLSGRKNNNLLDLGCGDGIITHNILSIDKSIAATLVDASEDMLNKAKERLHGFDNIGFIRAGFQDIMAKNLLKEDYDLAVSSMAIHHLTMDEKTELGVNDGQSVALIKRYKDAEENQPDTLDDQLNALRKTGFKEVDCYYKYGVFTVYGGEK